jgi:hypothetical protein
MNAWVVFYEGTERQSWRAISVSNGHWGAGTPEFGNNLIAAVAFLDLVTCDGRDARRNPAFWLVARAIHHRED